MSIKTHNNGGGIYEIISLPILFYSFKDGQEILESDRINIVREKDYLGYYELVINEVYKEDAGAYMCKAVNKFGEALCEAQVTTVGK